jgi:1-deoxy-D-xylulose 5-phosphate reductoisomerase
LAALIGQKKGNIMQKSISLLGSTGSIGTQTLDVARKLGLGGDGTPVVIAATATPYKFPETCRNAFGADVLDNPPPSFRDLEKLPIAQTKVVDVDGIDGAVRELFG